MSRSGFRKGQRIYHPAVGFCTVQTGTLDRDGGLRIVGGRIFSVSSHSAIIVDDRVERECVDIPWPVKTFYLELGNRKGFDEARAELIRIAGVVS